MSQKTTKIEPRETPAWCEKSFRSFEQGLNGSASGAVHALRKNAFERFSTLGFPTPKQEDWKYTNISAVVKNNYLLASPAERSTEAELRSALGLEFPAISLVFVNAHYNEDLSRALSKGNSQPAGVCVRSIGELLKSTGEDVEKQTLLHQLETSATETDAFPALNTAFLQDGAYIHISKKVELETPIHVVQLSVNSGESTISYPRSLIVLEEGAHATVVESFVGCAAVDYVSNAFVEMMVGDNAKLTYYKLQREQAAATHFGTVRWKQFRDSRVKMGVFSLGASLTRNDILPTLNGSGAEILMVGLNVLKDSQHVDNHTVVTHAEPNCQSTQLFKGVYGDSSKGVFDGTIIVESKAQKTNAIQSNKNLLLSNEASVDTKPQLKIWADDVKCTHGATVGQLDEKALFYLRSRGIETDKAKQILTYAFAREIVDTIELPALKEFVDAEIELRLAEIVC